MLTAVRAGLRTRTPALAVLGTRFYKTDFHVPSNDPKWGTPADAVAGIKSGDRVWCQMAGATPNTLLKALVGRSEGLSNVEICQFLCDGPAPFLQPGMEGHFRFNSFFIGGNARRAINEKRADFTPIFFHAAPRLYREGKLPIDVAFLHVTPPDQHGYVSLGLSVADSLAAIDAAKYIVAQVNPKMPRILGNAEIHISKINKLCWSEDELPMIPPAPATEIDTKIAANVAALIPDGACLQAGIGSLPDTILRMLKNHKNLGIHTELLTNEVMNLIKVGAVTNKNKKVLPGKNVATFVLGSRELYDFLNDNTSVHLDCVGFVNHPMIIAKNPLTHAINACLEVDLTGQVVSGTIGTKLYSGIGGQMDFIQGATWSQGGKGILAMASTAKGISKIVPMIKPGASVSVSNNHVHWIVTEYGAVCLQGKTLRERAKLLISIAHPEHRAALEKAAVDRFGPL